MIDQATPKEEARLLRDGETKLDQPSSFDGTVLSERKTTPHFGQPGYLAVSSDPQR